MDGDKNLGRGSEAVRSEEEGSGTEGRVQGRDSAAEEAKQEERKALPPGLERRKDNSGDQEVADRIRGVAQRELKKTASSAGLRGQGTLGGAGKDTSIKFATREIDALHEADQMLSESVRQQAAEYVPGAIASLGEFSQGQSVNGIEPSASVVAKTARDIIEFAGGRPETRDPNTTDPSQQVHIYIQDFGTKEYKEVKAELDDDSTSTALIEAEELSENDVSGVFEVPYAEEDSGEAS